VLGQDCSLVPIMPLPASTARPILTFALGDGNWRLFGEHAAAGYVPGLEERSAE